MTIAVMLLKTTTQNICSKTLRCTKLGRFSGTQNDVFTKLGECSGIQNYVLMHHEGSTG